VTEFKHLTGQKHHKSSLVYEYPQAEGDPYYPIPKPECTALYNRYKELADATRGVHFVGRLATYKYYNMDQVVGQGLALFDKLVETENERIVLPSRIPARSSMIPTATIPSTSIPTTSIPGSSIIGPASSPTVGSGRKAPTL